MWAVVRNEDIIHHTSNIIHLGAHHTSYISEHIKPQHLITE